METYLIPCLLGLEKLVSDEVKRLGLQEVQAENGRILCRGTLADAARLNLNLRCGARVLLVLGRFPARSFEELFQGTRAIAWEDYLPENAAFPVKGYSISSQLHSVPACQSIIKKAMVERMKAHYHREQFPEDGVKYLAKKLHMDVYDEIVYRTRKLRRRHDDLVLKCQEKDIELQAEEMEEKFPHVNAICQEIKAKYEYADADYMVMVPSGILDIITEGRALHHCAGSSDRYWDRIERRESFVMFLRKTADPFHAYYTLEVEPDGTVRQKRTEYDRQKKDIEQATEFLQKWQRVITARLTESDKALAAESRILREKEFIQLKKDRVIIHTGHLAGKLLVDVLMADLMENTDSIQSPALAAAA